MSLEYLKALDTNKSLKKENVESLLNRATLKKFPVVKARTNEQGNNDRLYISQLVLAMTKYLRKTSARRKG